MELAKRCGFNNYTPERAARDATVRIQGDEPVNDIMEQYQHLFQGISKFKHDQINFQIDNNVCPERMTGLALGYQSKLSEHLQYLKENDVIEGPLDSSVEHTWISNVVITEKKETNKIRMTVDMRHINIQLS